MIAGDIEAIAIAELFILKHALEFRMFFTMMCWMVFGCQ